MRITTVTCAQPPREGRQVWTPSASPAGGCGSARIAACPQPTAKVHHTSYLRRFPSARGPGHERPRWVPHWRCSCPGEPLRSALPTAQVPQPSPSLPANVQCVALHRHGPTPPGAPMHLIAPYCPYDNLNNVFPIVEGTGLCAARPSTHGASDARTEGHGLAAENALFFSRLS